MSLSRPAAVAGTFYPGSPETLAAEIATYLSQAPGQGGHPPKALIVPHAGYLYSGCVAASAYARIRGLAGRVRRVVLAGPAHTVPVRGVAVPAVEAFETPLGTVPVDRAALESIRDLAFVEVSDRAHAREHSLEVQLPFLQRVLADFTLVPLVVGDARVAEMAEVLDRLWGGEETLVVVSSDLSHYLSYRDARSLDRDTAGRILDLESGIGPEQACGAHPVNGLLRVARRRGLHPELLDLRNSGDTAGSRDRVVGYGAFAFHEASHA